MIFYILSIVFICLFILIILLQILPATLILMREDKVVWLTVKYFNFTVLKKQFGSKKQKQSTKNSGSESKDDEKVHLNILQRIERTKKSIDFYKPLVSELIKYSYGKIIADNVEFKITYGTSNAALTGILNGIGYGIIHYLDNVLSAKIRFNHKSYQIVPVFNQSIFKFEYHLVIKGKIIYVLNMILKSYLYIRKNNDKKRKV